MISLVLLHGHAFLDNLRVDEPFLILFKASVLVLLDAAEVVLVIFGSLTETQVLLLLSCLCVYGYFLLIYQVLDCIGIRLVLSHIVLLLWHNLLVPRHPVPLQIRIVSLLLHLNRDWVEVLWVSHMRRHAALRHVLVVGTHFLHMLFHIFLLIVLVIEVVACDWCHKVHVLIILLIVFLIVFLHTFLILEMWRHLVPRIVMPVDVVR